MLYSSEREPNAKTDGENIVLEALRVHPVREGKGDAKGSGKVWVT